MFTKLANEIDFNDIKLFCSKWGEGMRVEYKSEIAHIPKIISSFANTQGGIFIIGVETDQNNKVKPPIIRNTERGRNRRTDYAERAHGNLSGCHA